MAVGYSAGALFAFEITNFVVLTVLGMLTIKAILKIGFKQYELGWGAALKLSAYTFGTIGGLTFFLKLGMGEAFFMAQSFIVMLIIVAAVFIAKKYLTKVGVEDKIWHLSILWIILTYIVGIFFMVGAQ